MKLSLIALATSLVACAASSPDEDVSEGSGAATAAAAEAFSLDDAIAHDPNGATSIPLSFIARGEIPEKGGRMVAGYVKDGVSCSIVGTPLRIGKPVIARRTWVDGSVAQVFLAKPGDDPSATIACTGPRRITWRDLRTSLAGVIEVEEAR